jgi:2-polyprenyl-3-methyl-5-hydroxy-6-metoxy-1,4-benzoquinol methylase
MTTTSQCPACGETTQSPFLQCIDHTVSHETFSIVKCARCEFAFTNPYPDLSKLGEYYLSTAYISHSSKPTSLIDHVYVLARKQTLKWKTGLVTRHSAANSENLLDYGCGTGDFLNACKTSGWNITGVEPSAVAQQIAAEKTSQTIYSKIDDLPPLTFDTITLWHVLEHVPDLNTLLSTLNKKLDRTGTIFIAVPNRSSWDANYYKETWAGYDVPRHLWHFRQTDMQNILKAHSLNVIKTIPMKLDAYYVSLLSEKYRHQKLNLLTMLESMVNGLRSNISARRTTEYSSLIYVIKK